MQAEAEGKKEALIGVGQEPGKVREEAYGWRNGS